MARKKRRRWLRRLVIATLFLVALGGAGWLFYHFRVIVPNFRLRDMSFYDLPAEEQRAVYHQIVSWPWGGNYHDAFLGLGKVGNEESVRLMIGRMWWDCSAGGGISGECTIFHCEASLRRLTNHDPGYGRSAWQQWWATHGHKSRDEWIRDGFVAAGLPVSDPPDEVYVRSLVNVLVDSAGYHRPNALRVLRNVPGQILTSCMVDCVGSPSPRLRRGAAVGLMELRPPEHLSMLRALSEDADPDVRSAGLTCYNALLRKAAGELGSGEPIWTADIGDTITTVAHVDDMLLLVTESSGHSPVTRQTAGLFGVDPRTRRIAWKRSFPCGCTAYAWSSGGRVLFYDNRDTLYCLRGLTGDLLWKASFEKLGLGWYGGPVQLPSGVAFRNQQNERWVVDLQSGEKRRTPVVPLAEGQRFESEAADAGLRFALVLNVKKDRWQRDDVVDGARLCQVSDEGRILRRVAVDGTVFYVTARDGGIALLSSIHAGKTFSVTLYDARDLSVRWTQQFEKDTYDSPEQHLHSRSLVVVKSHDSLFALDVRDGKTVWWDSDDRWLDLVAVDERFLLVEGGTNQDVEVRDAKSGRILLARPGEAGCLVTAAESSSPILVAGGDDGILRAFTIPTEGRTPTRPIQP